MQDKEISSVEEMERFFNTNFSYKELSNAIEKSDIYYEDLKKNYNLSSISDRTFLLGVLATETLLAQKNFDPQKTQNTTLKHKNVCILGLEIAKGRYTSYSEVEPLITTAFYDNSVGFDLSGEGLNATLKIVPLTKEDFIKKFQLEMAAAKDVSNIHAYSQKVIEKLSPREKMMLGEILSERKCDSEKKLTKFLRSAVNQKLLQKKELKGNSYEQERN